LKVRGEAIRSQAYLFAVGAIVMLLTTFSIPADRIVIGGDAILPALDPGVALQHFFHTWNSSAGLGEDTSFPRPILFPFVLFDWILARVGFTPSAINNGWLICILAVQAVSLAWLTRTLFPRIATWLVCYAGILSVVNPYVLITFHSPYPTTALSIALFPAVVGALWWFSRGQTVARFARVLVLALFMAVGDANYGVTIAEVVFLLPIVCALAAQTRSMSGALQFLVVTSLVFLSANLLWLLPAYHYLHGALQEFVSNSREYTDSTLAVTSEYSGLENSSRLIGDYLFFNNGGDGKPFLAEGQAYVRNIALVVATSVLPALIAIGAVVWRRNRTALCVLALTLTALFFAKGTAQPLGSVFASLFAHLSFFSAFRDSYSKLEWVVAYGYAMLAALTLQSLFAARTRLTAIAAITLASVTLSGGFPILFGHLFYEQTLVAIPSAYGDMARWFNHRPDAAGRILQTPVSPYFFDAYRWGYVGSGLNTNLIERPIVSRMFDFPSPGTRAIDDAFQHLYTTIGPSRAAAALGMYGVRYVIDDPSIRPGYFNGSFHADRIGRAFPRTTMAAHFGSVNVYEVDDALINDRFYTAAAIYTGVTDFEQLALLCSLRRCRDTVTLDPRTKPALDPGGAKMSFDPPAHLETSSHRYARAPLLRTLHGSDSRRNTHSTRDYGNGTVVRDGSFATYLSPITYGNAPPVEIAIDDNRRKAAVDISALRLRPTTPAHFPIRQCSGRRRTPDVNLHFATSDQVGSDLILRVVYQSKSPVLVRVLADGSSPQSFFTSLATTDIPRAFLRILRPNPSIQDVRVRIELPAAKGTACASIREIALARIYRTRHPLEVTGSAATMQATPAYVAFNASLSAIFASRALVEGRGTSVAQRQESRVPLTDDSLDWTDYEGLTPSAKAPGKVTLDDHSQGEKRLRVAVGNADAHLSITHLLPGGRYRFTFPYQLAGTGRIVISSLAGERLAAGSLVEGKATTYTTDVRVPGDSSGFVVYVYLESDASRDGATLTLRRVGLSSLDSFHAVDITGEANVERPRRLSVDAKGDGSFLLTAGDAPRQYCVVFNETYSDDWLLEPTRSTSGLRIEHLKANVYQNGWLIRGGSGDETFVLRYVGDDIAKKSALLSLLLAASALLIVLVSRVRHRAGKRNVTL